LLEITIPESIISIGRKYFMGCSKLYHVNISSKISIPPF
jgi:hypothetical protein